MTPYRSFLSPIQFKFNSRRLPSKAYLRIFPQIILLSSLLNYVSASPFSIDDQLTKTAPWKPDEIITSGENWSQFGSTNDSIERPFLKVDADGNYIVQDFYDTSINDPSIHEKPSDKLLPYSSPFTLSLKTDITDYFINTSDQNSPILSDYQLYDLGGNKTFEIMRKNDNKSLANITIEQTYAPNNSLILERHFQAELLHGAVRYWLSDNLTQERFYKKGEPDQYWQTFEASTLIDRHCYESGKRLIEPKKEPVPESHHLAYSDREALFQNYLKNNATILSYQSDQTNQATQPWQIGDIIAHNITYYDAIEKCWKAGLYRRYLGKISDQQYIVQDVYKSTNTPRTDPYILSIIDHNDEVLFLQESIGIEPHHETSQAITYDLNDPFIAAYHPYQMNEPRKSEPLNQSEESSFMMDKIVHHYDRWHLLTELTHEFYLYAPDGKAINRWLHLEDDPLMILTDAWHPNGDLAIQHHPNTEDFKTTSRTWRYQSWYTNGMAKEDHRYESDDEILFHIHTMPQPFIAHSRYYRAWYPDGRFAIDYIHEEAQRLFTLFYPNGEIESSGSYSEEGEPIGIWRSWHDNGQPMIQGVYSTQDLGRIDDPWIGFYRDGTLFMKALGGPDPKIWQYWHPNGELMAEGRVIFDEGFGFPIRQGLWNFYHDNGVNSHQIEFREDLPNIGIIYDDSKGEMIENHLLSQYDSQKSIELKSLYPPYQNGNILRYGLTNASNGDRYYQRLLGATHEDCYLIQDYYDRYNLNRFNNIALGEYSLTLNEQFSWLQRYNDPNLSSTYKSCSLHSNDKLKTLTHWMPYGQPEGEIQLSYPNGERWKIITYHAGKKEGKYREYYPNGSLKSAGNYLNDEQIGQWHFWNRAGELISIP